jgi:hypothetical protein
MARRKYVTIFDTLFQLQPTNPPLTRDDGHSCPYGHIVGRPVSEHLKVLFAGLERSHFFSLTKLTLLPAVLTLRCG